jgi:hypothetical protein
LLVAFSRVPSVFILVSLTSLFRFLTGLSLCVSSCSGPELATGTLQRELGGGFTVVNGHNELLHSVGLMGSMRIRMGGQNPLGFSPCLKEKRKRLFFKLINFGLLMYL